MQKGVHYLLLTILISCTFGRGYSQNLKPEPKSNSTGKAIHKTLGYATPKWIINDPFEQKVFIENNEGQFDGKTASTGEKIIFSTRINEVYLYFSSTGITYRYDQYHGLKNDWNENKEKENINPDTQFFSINWKGANKNTSVLAEDEVGFYYTYPKGNKHTTIAHAFKKLLYKNIYPGIDIEYSLPGGEKGLEYAIIIHPGANLSRVKMRYLDAKNIWMSSEGNIESQSSFGQFIDHAPINSFYQDDRNAVNCSFTLNDNEVSYSSNYDHTKTLVIDPWMVNPGFTNYDAGYDVCYDLRGNVYAYGSFSPYQEIKINSNGVVQWIYTIPNTDPQYGDFAVDEATGISYDGSCTYPYIYKVDTSGLQTNSYWVDNNLEELWRMAFNKCENQVILAGGGTASTNQACTIDTGLTTLNPVNVLGAATGHHDMSLLAIDNDNSSIFLGSSLSNYDPTNFDNVVARSMLPALTPTTYIVSDGFDFTENCCDVNYIDGVTGHSLAMNGAVVSPNWLYFYDGATLRRYNKNTGVTVLTKTITPTQYSWGGIDVDLCDNLYLAYADTIMVYDSSLNNIGKILAPNNVYDLHIAPNNILVASGLKFVSSFTITTNPVSVSFSNIPSSCTGSTGKATATMNGCGSDSSTYSYLWSNGATTQTDTGLVAGTYTVYISSGCDFIFSDTITIIGSNSDGMSLTTSQTNVLCNGDTNSSASVTVSGGTAPYTYSWAIIGKNTQSVSNLSAGIYTVTVYDSKGCISATINITQPPALSTSIIKNNISCNGMSNGIATALVTGGTGAYTYLWSPFVSSVDSAINLSAGTYTVTIKDSNGCMEKDTVSITQPLALVSTVAPLNVNCYGASNGTVTTSVKGGTGPYKYLWTPSGGTNSVASNLSAGTYTITITDSKGCLLIDSVTITQPAKIIAAISGLDSICSGNSETLTVSGGGTYLWSTSQTTSTISISVSATKTYSCTVTIGGCSVDTSITIFAIPNIPINLTLLNDSICIGDSTTILATGGSNYKWSNGSTSSSILVKPNITTIYTLYASNACNNDTIKETVHVLPIPIPSISGKDTICKGQSTRLTATGGVTYLWNNGLTSSSITVNPSKDTSYSVKAFNGLCSADTSIRITVNSVDGTINGPFTTCTGDSVVLNASGGGTYLWNTGATSSSITIYPISDSTITVTVSSAGCKENLKTTVSILNPNLYACCDTTISPGDSTFLNASGASAYVWMPPYGLNCKTCPDPVANPTITTTYTVTGTNSGGCETARIITVYVELNCKDLLIVPNVFTPNGDGRNDAFSINASNASAYSIIIYDRWGKVMYKSTNPDVYWNGTTLGGNAAPDGVYYYIIKATCQNYDYEKDGFVQVIR